MTRTKRIINKLSGILLLAAAAMPTSLVSCGNSSSDEVKEKARDHFSKVYEATNEFKIDTVLFLNASVPNYLTDKNLDKTFKKVDDGFFALILGVGLTGKENGLEKHRDEIGALFSEAFEPLQNLLDSVTKKSNDKQRLALVAYSPIDNSKDGEVKKILYVLGENEENLILDSIQVTKHMKHKVFLIAASQIKIMEWADKTTKELDEAAKNRLKDPVLRFIAY